MTRSFLVSLIVILIFTSCTIAKRQHQPGFYFSWQHYVSEIKEISSNQSNQLKAEVQSEVFVVTTEEKKMIEKNDTIQPQSVTQIQSTPKQTEKLEIPKEEMMKVAANQIQAIHRIKQVVTAGGLFGVLYGSFYFATASSVMFPFLGVMLLVALFAGITALIAFVITVKVKNFKKKYPEFSETPEYKKALKARKRARLSLYFSYGLASLAVILALFAVLIDFLTVY